MKSLRAALANKGIRPPVSIPGCFQSSPGSIKKLIQCAEQSAPEMPKWKRSSSYFDESWTANFQGLAYGWKDNLTNSTVWFFTNEWELLKILVKPGGGWQVLKSYDWSSLNQWLPNNTWHHFGNPDYYNGLVLVPYEAYDKSNNAILLAFNPELEFIGWAEFVGKEDSTNTGWCAINRWNDLLYVSDDILPYFINPNDLLIPFIDPDKYKEEFEAFETKVRNGSFLYAYEISELFALLKMPGHTPKKINIALKDRRYKLLKQDGTLDALVGSMQGVVFSPNGRIYVTLATLTQILYGYPTAWDNYLICYDTLTGKRLEDMEIKYPRDVKNEELQGLTFCNERNELFIAFLDNEPGKDEMDILNYSYDKPI